MTDPKAFRGTLAALVRGHGFVQRKSAWYKRQTETIAVLELQKSSYGQQYYVNVALWLLRLGDNEFPEERHCHVRTRMDQLLPAEADQLKAALDLDSPLADQERKQILQSALARNVIPLLASCATIKGLAAPAGQSFLRSALLTRQAQTVLQATPNP